MPYLIALCLTLVPLLGACSASRRAPPPVAAAKAPEPASAPVATGTAASDAGSAPAAAAAVPAAADSPGAEADDATRDDPAAQALEQCQSAAAILDRGGDDADAVRSIDECYAQMLALPDDDTYAQAKQDIRVLVADLVRRLYPQKHESTPAALASWDLGLPEVDNEHVQYEIKSFTTVERAHLLEGYRRSGRYRGMILKKLAAAGLPSQLSWLPLVESSFMTGALSRASALGLWQFISSTGLRYGLKRDKWVDQRLDPEKATDAAISYLIDLHSLFGDWPKALAAYNCGENRVLHLQQRAGGYQDIWDLYGQLPDETRRYFPRLLAVLHIIEDPARYGITLPEPDKPEDEVARVKIDRPVRLEDLDKALGLAAGTLAQLNPELRQKSTPQEAYELKVPASAAETVVAAVEKVPAFVPRVPEYIVHRVRSGDTLSVIARSYRTSVSVIMRLNGLTNANRLRRGQRLRVPSRS